MPESALEQLAAAAHEIWCQYMIEAGWRPGPLGSFDESQRVHDALVPFERLDHDDRWTAIESVGALHLESELVEAISYPRGPERPFTTQEMVVDLRVMSAFEPPTSDDSPLFGRVVEWAVHPRSNRLEWIKVLWDDGSLVVHSPLENELRRVPSQIP